MISASSGVVSNIDYSTLISQLVGIKRESITQLETEKTTLKSAKSAYSTLSTKVKELITASDALKTGSAFSVFKTNTSDNPYFKASANATAAAGSYEITVNTLAKAHRMAADGVASDTTVVGTAAGSFSFQVGAGEIKSVTVDTTTTLAGLRDSINALKAGVTAHIANDAPGSYRLVLTSGTTGTGGTVNVTQNDTSLVFSTTLQAAQDASVTMDGMTYTRQTNSIGDMIGGVTLDLESADTLKTSTLTVSRDTESIEKKVKAFIDGYNAVVTHIKLNNRYDSETKKGGPFFGDSVARSIWDDLRRVMSSAVSGLPDTMNRLMHAGIKVGDDGLYSLDSSKFSSALSTNYDDVVNLFTKGTTVSGFGELVHAAASSIDDMVDGRIKGRQDGIDKNIKRLDEDIRKKEAQLVTYEDQIRAQFTGLETMIASLNHQSAALMSLYGG